MNYKREYLKRIVKLRIKLRNYQLKSTTNFIKKNLTSEEILLLHTVKELALRNRSCIRFDVVTSETMIVLEDKLVTLKHGKVCIDNHRGFSYVNLPDVAYGYLLDIVHKQAHIDRRRLKHIVKTNLQEFLKSVK